MKATIMTCLLIVGLQIYADPPTIRFEPGAETAEEALNKLLAKERDESGKPYRGSRQAAPGFSASQQLGDFGKINLTLVEKNPIAVIRSLLSRHNKRMNFYPHLKFRISNIKETNNGGGIIFEQTIDGIAIDNTLSNIYHYNGRVTQMLTVSVDPDYIDIPDINVIQANAETVALQVIEGELGELLNEVTFDSVLRYDPSKKEAYWDVRISKGQYEDYRVEVNATTSEAKSYPTSITIFM